MTSRNAAAYGRAATTRSCARLSLDVATISIVRVIFRVFSTERIRPLISRPFAISRRLRPWAERRCSARRGGRSRALALPLEIRREALDRAAQRRLDVLAQRLLGSDAGRDVGRLRRKELVESLLPSADVADRDRIEEPVRHSVD